MESFYIFCKCFLGLNHQRMFLCILAYLFIWFTHLYFTNLLKMLENLFKWNLLFFLCGPMHNSEDLFFRSFLKYVF